MYTYTLSVNISLPANATRSQTLGSCRARLSRFDLSDTPTPDRDTGSRSLSQLGCRTPEGPLAAFAPAIGASSAESRGRLGSSEGPAPATILGSIAAGTFPETMGHSPRGFCCYSGQLLHCSGACERALSKHLDAANTTKTAPPAVKSRKNLATPVETCGF
jgi:hypothetical protein